MHVIGDVIGKILTLPVNIQARRFVLFVPVNSFLN